MDNRQNNNSENHEKILWAVAIIVLSLLIVIGISGVITDPELIDSQDVWYVFIKEFQTLIGGLLAVGAAFITIRQMAKTDERADARHFELIRLQLAPQQNALSTLQRIFYRELEQELMGRSAICEELKSMTNDRATARSFSNFRASKYNEMEKLPTMLANDHWEVHRVGMNAELLAALDKVRSSCATVQGSFRHIGALNHTDQNRLRYCDELEFHLKDLENFLNLFVAN